MGDLASQAGLVLRPQVKIVEGRMFRPGTSEIIAGKAIAIATQAGEGNDLALKLDYATKAAGAYPIVLVTYEIACETGGDAALVPLVKAFLTYTASDEGQGKLGAAGYVPITGDLLTKVRTAVAAIS